MPSSVEGLRLFLKGSTSQKILAIEDHSQPRNAELSRRNHAGSGAVDAELRQVLPFCPGALTSWANRKLPMSRPAADGKAGGARCGGTWYHSPRFVHRGGRGIALRAVLLA